jgi:hypothetical protein
LLESGRKDFQYVRRQSVAKRSSAFQPVEPFVVPPPISFANLTGEKPCFPTGQCFRFALATNGNLPSSTTNDFANGKTSVAL